MRSSAKHLKNWGLPGGKVEGNETLLECVNRECKEELGFMPEYLKLVPIEKFTSPDSHFCYHTFFCLIENEFKPILNDEHLGYAWIQRGVWPHPMHPGLWKTVNFNEVNTKIDTLITNYTSQ